MWGVYKCEYEECVILSVMRNKNCINLNPYVIIVIESGYDHEQRI